ncbi:VOC family protein [Solibacillus daqui]|uniref:VOC family protein n=1 Tax=Solibacillus daqui TaxID=2912187 RepID=UPI0023672C4F|nr:VOC family protein [Solibacillus daqui]
MNQVCVITIYVPNLNEAINFYTNSLGFEVNKQYSPKIVSLVHKGIPFILEENDQLIENTASTSRVVLALKTENIVQKAKLLKEKSVEFLVAEPTACPPGKFISFKDPFGNIIEYLQFDDQ